MNINKARYNSGYNNISIDLLSHLESGDISSVSHELTHYILTNYTNAGVVFSILCQISNELHNLAIDVNKIKMTLNLLHKDMYEVQEGMSHLIQAEEIYGKGGMSTVKEWEDSLPLKPKIAFSFVRFVLELPLRQKEDFKKMIPYISLNTDICHQVIKDPNFLINGALEIYLNDENNSSEKRFEKVTRSIEKDNDLLNLNVEELCEKIGLSVSLTLTIKDKVDLVNKISMFTTSPELYVESDVACLSDSEVITAAMESMQIVDANLISSANSGRGALVLNDEYDILKEIRYARTIFIPNTPRSNRVDNHFGFYSFSGNRHVVDGLIAVGEKSKEMLRKKDLTVIIDTFAFDFDKCEIKPERRFCEPNILWHKSFVDFGPFIKMAEKMNLTVEAGGYSINDLYGIYLFRVQGIKLFHVTACFPFMNDKLSSAKFKLIGLDFFEMIKGERIHFNNFAHDILGIPFLNDCVDVQKNSKNRVEQVRKNGMSRNDACICGSGKKWKNCHGR